MAGRALFCRTGNRLPSIPPAHGIIVLTQAGRLFTVEIAPRITVDEKVRFGKPVIKGTRVPVDLILGKLAGGMTYEEVMSEYDIAKADILAALRYAAQQMAGEEVKAVG
ncbi:MAG: DUF433 domain-containing protein [Nitrospinae bacterium]|nr:DUF433 domain-containing protein [Nitrospinota bacterium]